MSTSTIYQVKHSEETKGNFFSTLNQAQKHADKLMKLFGGEWEMKRNDETGVAYVSNRSFEYCHCISRMSVRITPIQLNAPEAPRLRVSGVYIDYEGKEIFKLQSVKRG